MKLTIRILIALLISQYIAGQDLKIGVCVNPQITWITPESKSVDNEGAALGISGGLNFDNYFRKNYALNLGIHLSSQAGSLRFSQGAEIDGDDTTFTIPIGSVVDYRINTITIPVGIKLKTNEIGYFSYYAQLGFTNQIRLKAKASSGKNLEKDLITKEIKPFNMSYHFGAGIEYALSEDTALSFGIFYTNGFLDLTKHPPRTYIRSISFCLGVIF
jgi:opacity protein-like surface antigen